MGAPVPREAGDRCKSLAGDISVRVREEKSFPISGRVSRLLSLSLSLADLSVRMLSVKICCRILGSAVRSLSLVSAKRGKGLRKREIEKVSDG